jgi:hypothetical protein
LSPLESKRVIVALLLSLFLHVAVWGTYEAGKKLGYWDRLRALLPARHLVKKGPPPAQQSEAQDRQIFVDVSHPEADAPQKTQFYSDKNSLAANPDSSVDSNQPKLNGKQKDIPKTEDVERLQKLQPSATPTPPQPQTPPAPQPPPPSPFNMGDVKLAKTDTPADRPDETPPTPVTKPRPRTIKEAMAQQHQLPGRLMQQDGGVRRARVWTSLDAKATPFGDYDRAIIEAVTQRWYDLLDSRRFALDRTGRVILHFKLKSDGSVEELTFLANDAGTTLGYVCEESIMEAAPFAKWPPDMRRMIGENFRDITFTFDYYQP